jgi:hypothetical protein
MDETWLYQYDPETKQQSVEWRYSGSPCPEKFRVQTSAGKILASSFWDQDGILLTDYFLNGQLSTRISGGVISGVPRNFVRRRGSTNSVEDRENSDLGALAP